FGIGTTPIPIGSTKVDIGVKGSAMQPAFASLLWRTPREPGHYCLQVLLDPVDDRNTLNNLGQENTDVGVASSPASFIFTLRNDGRKTRRYRFDVTSYTLKQAPCDDDDEKKRLERHRRGHHPVPDGWTVDISPDQPSLGPDESVQIKVTITPPEGFRGEQVFNVDAFDGHGPAGGVTLTVVGEG
ncbi:MAG: NEW3 domain-containing protein, partial [Rhodothermales bacterium]